jgi:hypothetical protein
VHFVTRFAAPLLLFLIVISCASIDPPPAREESSFFLARYNKVWATTLKVLDAQSLSIQTSDKDKGTITTKFVDYSSGEKAHHELEEIAYKPDIPLGLYTHVHNKLSIQVIPVSEMSMQIKVSANIEAYDKNVTRKWHTCISKNVVEQTMLDRIRAAL